NVLGVFDRHHQTVDPSGDAAVWRHAVLESVEQVTELAVYPLAIHSKDLEHSLLQLAVVDADAATRNLDSVHHAVVRSRPHVIRSLSQKMHVFWPGRCEWMVAIGQVAQVVLLEHVHGVDPQELPLALADQLAAPCDLAAQQAHDGFSLPAAIRDEKDEVVRPRARGGPDRGQLAFAQMAIQWARDPRQALRACALGE